MEVPWSPHIYVNSTFGVEVWPGESANYTGISIELFYNGTLYQTRTLPPRSLAPVLFSVAAPMQPESIRLSWRISGSDVAHFITPANLTVAVLPSASFNISGVPARVNISTTGHTLPATVPPTPVQASQFTFTVRPTGMPTGPGWIGVRITLSSSGGSINLATPVFSSSNWTTGQVVTYTAPTQSQDEVFSFEPFGLAQVVAQFTPRPLPIRFNVQALLLLSAMPQLGAPGLLDVGAPQGGLFNSEPATAVRVHMIGATLLSGSLTLRGTGSWFINGAPSGGSGVVLTMQTAFSPPSTTPVALAFSNPSTELLPAAVLASATPGWPSNINVSMGIEWNITSAVVGLADRFVLPQRSFYQSYVPHGLSVVLPALLYSKQPQPFTANLFAPVLANLTVTFVPTSGAVQPNSALILPGTTSSPHIYLSPTLPVRGASRPTNVSVRLTGADRYRFQLREAVRVGADLPLTILAQESWTVSYSPFTPSCIYQNETFWLSVQPSAPANYTGLNVTMDVQDVFVSSRRLPARSMAPLQFTVTAPSTVQTLNISWRQHVDDSDYWHFAWPQWLLVPVLQRETFIFSASYPAASVEVNSTTTWTVRPSAIPTGSGWIGIDLFASRGTLSVRQLIWNQANWTTPASVSYMATRRTEFITLSYAYSASSPYDVNAEYILPSARELSVLASWTWTNAPLAPSGMYPGQPSHSLAISLRPFGILSPPGTSLDVRVRAYWLLDGAIPAAMQAPQLDFVVPFRNFSEDAGPETAPLPFVFPRTLPPPLQVWSNLTYGRLVLLLNFSISGPDAWHTAAPHPVLLPCLWPGAVRLQQVPAVLYGTQPANMLMALEPFPVLPQSFLTVAFAVSGGGELHSHPNGLVNFTSIGGNATAQSVRVLHYAPFVPGPVAGQISFTLSLLNTTAAGGEFYRWFIPPGQQQFVIPIQAQAWFIVQTPPSRTFINQRFSMSLQPTEVAQMAGVATSVAFVLPLGVNGSMVESIQGSQQMSPSAGLAALQYPNMLAPPTPRQLTIVFNHSGSDYYHFRPIPRFNLTIWPQTQWNVTVLDSVYLNQLFNVHVTPHEVAEFSGIDVAVMVDGVQAAVAHLDPGTFGPVQFVLRAPTVVRLLELSFTVTGSDVAHFVAPPTTIISVIRPTNFNISGMPTAVAINSVVSNISFVPNIRPRGTGDIALRLSVSGSGSVFPSYLRWTGGNWSEPALVSLGVPGVARALVITYEVLGDPDTVAQFTPGPPPSSIAVQGSMVLAGVPTEGLWTSQPSGSIVATPAGADPQALPDFALEANASWVLLRAGGLPPQTLATSVFIRSVPFRFTTSAQLLSFTVPHRSTIPTDALALLPEGPLSMLRLQLSFACTGPSGALFAPPAPVLLPINLPFAVAMPIPSQMYSGQEWNVTATLAGLVERDLAIVMSVNAGASLTPTSVVLGPTTERDSFPASFVAPLIATGGAWRTVTLSATLSGTDRFRFFLATTTPAHAEGLSAPRILVLPRATFNVSIAPLVVYANRSWTVTLTPSAYANFTGVNVTLLAEGLGALRTVHMAPGSMAPLVFNLIAPGPPLEGRNLTMSIVVSGSDQAHFTVPAPWLQRIMPRTPFIFRNLPAGDPFPAVLSSQSSGLISVSPGEAPNLSGVSLSMSVLFMNSPAPSMVSPSRSFSFPAGRTDAIWSFMVTAPRVDRDQPLLLSFTLTGTDAAHFIEPSPLRMTVQYPKAWFDVVGFPSPRAFSYLSSTLTVTMTQPEYLGTPVTLSLVNLLDATQPPVHSIMFAFSSSQSFTVTLPVFVPAAGTNSTLLGWRVSDDLHFTAPAVTAPWFPYPPNHYGPTVIPCPCGPQGTCDDGPRGTGRCTCAPRWNGTRCDQCTEGFFGPTCQPCVETCTPGESRCDDGVTGTGACVCFPGFTGDRCLACQAGFFGPRCLPCPACERGVCVDGRTGPGCVCETGWGGSTCSVVLPGSLVTFHQSVSGFDGSFVLITLNATISSSATGTSTATAFTAKLLSMPSLGQLFQTADGVTPGSALTSPGAVVTSRANQLLYLMPPVFDPDAAGTGLPLVAFSWFASTPREGVSSPATVSIFALHVNLPPVLRGAAIDGQALGVPLLLSLEQNGRASLASAFSIYDADAGSAPVQVTLTTARGYFLFDSDVLLPAAWDGRQSVRSSSPLLPLSSWSRSPPAASTPTAINITSSTFNINVLLRGLYYCPLPFAYGSDTISIAASDLGNTGTDRGGPLTFTYKNLVNVWVEQVNQPIELLAGGGSSGRIDWNPYPSIRALENTPLTSLRLEAFDADSYFGVDRLEMTVFRGSISFGVLVDPASSGTLRGLMPPEFAVGTGKGGDVRVVVFAPLATLNALLRNFTYTPEARFTGSDELRVLLSDEGNSGRGGATQVERAFSIDVAFVDVPPRPMASTVSVREDSRAVVTLSAADQASRPVAGSSFVFSITALPDPNVAVLHQWAWEADAGDQASLMEAPRGKLINSVPTTVSDSQGRVLVRLRSGCIHGANVTSFSFRATKLPSGMVSVEAAPVAISILHVNHVPFVPDLVSASGTASLSDPAANRFLFRTVYSNTDLIVQLNATDVDRDDVLGFFIMSLPTRGALYQYDDSAPPGMPTAPGAPVISSNRGARIMRVGARVSSSLRRVVFAPLTNDGWTDPTAVYDSFAFAADDSQSQSLPFPIVNMRFKAASYPLAPAVDLSAPQDADTEVFFSLAAAQSLTMSLGAATVVSLPTVGSLFVRMANGARGEAITSAPFTLALPGSATAASLSTSVRVAPILALIYAPPLRAAGLVASLSYTLTDSVTGLSSTAAGAVRFNYRRVNHAPQAVAASFVNVYSTLVLPLSASDEDIALLGAVAANNVLSLRILTLPTRGQLQRMDGSVISTVPASVTGAGSPFQLRYVPEIASPYYTSFLFAAFDGTLMSPPTLVSLVAHAASVAPVSADATYSLLEGDALLIELKADDPRGTAASAPPMLFVDSAPALGSLSLLNGDRVAPLPAAPVQVSPDVRGKYLLLYRAASLSGLPSALDSFSYHAQEGDGARTVGNSATVKIQVSHRWVPPSVVSAVVTARTRSDESVRIELTGSSSEAFTLHASVASLPAVGTLYAVDCRTDAAGAALTRPVTLTPCPSSRFVSVLYSPPLHRFGAIDSDWLLSSFTYGLFDGTQASPSLARVDLHVSRRDYLPLAAALSVTLPAGTSMSVVQAQCEDWNGAAQDQLYVRVHSFPRRGLLYQLDDSAGDGSTIGAQLFSRLERVNDAAKRLIYVANFAQFGPDEFTYTCHIIGANNPSEPATVAVAVGAALLPPFLPLPPLSVAWNITQNALGILQLSYQDLEASRAVQLRITSLPERGQLFQVDSAFLFNPNASTQNPWGIEFGVSSAARGHAQRADIDPSIPDALGFERAFSNGPQHGGRRQQRMFATSGSSGAVVDLSSASTANPIPSPSPTGGWAALPTSANSLVFPPAPQQLLFSSSTSFARWPTMPLTARIVSPNTYVTHPQGLVGFIPDRRAAGNEARGFLYASLEYSAINLRNGKTSAAAAKVAINVPPVYLPPLAFTFSAETPQNTPVVLYLSGTASDGSAHVRASISTPPRMGTLCQVAPPSDFAEGTYPSACGRGFGVTALVGSQVTDPLLRIVYRPTLNVHGADSFGFKITNVDRAPAALQLPVGADTSIEANATLVVHFVNQAPTTNSSLSTYLVPIDTGRLSITLSASDPDDQLDAMRFVVTSIEGRGLFSFQRRTVASDGVVNTVAATLSPNSSFPFTLPTGVRTLLFDANAEGNAFPYTRLNFTVFDSVGNNASDYVQLQTDCGMLLFPNVWSSGSLCLPCPAGATCSELGDYKPISKPGYWRSDRVVADQPVYLQCVPAEACGGNIGFNSTDQCTAGFTGRICGDCEPYFYRNNGVCKRCASSQSFGMQVLIYVLPLSVGVALVLGLVVYLQLEMTFFSILFTFFQLVSTFKKFKLGWLPDTESMFGSLSVLLFDIEILQLSCSMPSLHYIEQWAMFMLLPWALLVVLLVLLHSFGFAWAVIEWRRLRQKPPTLPLAMRFRNQHRAIMRQGSEDKQLGGASGGGATGSSTALLSLTATVTASDSPMLMAAAAATASIKPLDGDTPLVGSVDGADQSDLNECDSERSEGRHPDIGATKDLAVIPSKSVSSALDDELADDPSQFLSPALTATLAPLATPPKHPGVGASLSQLLQYRRAYQRYLNDLAAALNIVPTGAIVDGTAHATLADIQAARFYAPPSVSRSFRAIVRHRLFWSHTMVVHAWMVFLNFAYLSLSIRAMEPLKCTRMDDGSDVLDARPALDCEEDWWYEWAPIATFATVFYALCVLVFFAYLMFRQRPPYDAVRLCRWFYFPIQLISASLRRRIWRNGLGKRRRASVAADAKQFLLARQVTSWQLRYRSMTSPFRRHYYFWTILLKLVSLLISIDAVWLASYPIYQAMAALLVLGAATLLQIRNRPFRFGTGMNELASVTNMCAMAIIFLGLLFNVNSLPGAKGRYQWVRIGLNELLKVFIGICLLVTMLLLRKQMAANFPDTCATSRERAKFRAETERIRRRNALAVHTATIEQERVSAPFLAPVSVQTAALLRNEAAASQWLGQLETLYALPKVSRKFLYAGGANGGGASTAVRGGHTKEELRVNAAGEVEEEDLGAAEPSQVAAVDDDERFMEWQARHAHEEYLALSAPQQQQQAQAQPPRRQHSCSTSVTPDGSRRSSRAEGELEPGAYAAAAPAPVARLFVSDDTRAASLLGEPGVGDDATLLEDLAPGIRDLVKKARTAAANRYSYKKEEMMTEAAPVAAHALHQQHASTGARRLPPMHPASAPLSSQSSPAPPSPLPSRPLAGAAPAVVEGMPTMLLRRKMRVAIHGASAAAAFAHALLMDKSGRNGNGTSDPQSIDLSTGGGSDVVAAADDGAGVDYGECEVDEDAERAAQLMRAAMAEEVELTPVEGGVTIPPSGVPLAAAPPLPSSARPTPLSATSERVQRVERELKRHASQLGLDDLDIDLSEGWHSSPPAARPIAAATAAAAGAATVAPPLVPRRAMLGASRSPSAASTSASASASPIGAVALPSPSLLPHASSPQLRTSQPPPLRSVSGTVSSSAALGPPSLLRLPSVGTPLAGSASPPTPAAASAPRASRLGNFTLSSRRQTARMIQQQQLQSQDTLRPHAQDLVHNEPSALAHSGPPGGGASSLSTAPAVDASVSSCVPEPGGGGDGAGSRPARTFAIVSARGPGPAGNRSSGGIGGALAAFEAPRRVARIGAAATAVGSSMAATVAPLASAPTSGDSGGPMQQQQQQQEECKVQ